VELDLAKIRNFIATRKDPQVGHTNPHQIALLRYVGSILPKSRNSPISPRSVFHLFALYLCKVQKGCQTPVLNGGTEIMVLIASLGLLWLGAQGIAHASAHLHHGHDHSHLHRRHEPVAGRDSTVTVPHTPIGTRPPLPLGSPQVSAQSVIKCN
jgi:hypothetical protein